MVFISLNTGTILIGILLLAAVTAAAAKMIRDKKSGKSCCGDCNSCSKKNGSCHYSGQQK